MNAPLRIDVDLLRGWPLPSLEGGADKQARGAVLVIAGSTSMPGAAVLAAEASLRAGAGKLEVAVPEGARTMVAGALPEAKVVCFPETKDGGPAARFRLEAQAMVERADAVLLGPGTSDEAAVARLAVAILQAHGKTAVVLDAAALTVLHDPGYRFPRPVVITPHPVEMAQLAGVSKEEVTRNPTRLARETAHERNAVVILKGTETFVAAPDGRLWIYQDGDAGLGTGGSGDVLAGLVTGLLARGATLEQAAAWGVALHGGAGRALALRIGAVGYLARELAQEVPRLLERFAPAAS